MDVSGFDFKNLLGKAIFGRISRAYVDLSGVFTSWVQTDKPRLYTVYEHEADDEVSRTHCHFVLWDSEATVKKIKERQLYKELKLSRSDHSYKEVEWIDIKDPLRVCQYMAKGTLMPVYSNLPVAVSEYFRNKWEEKKSKAKDYFDICMEIRDQCTYEACIDTKDEFGYPQIRTVRVMRNFDEVYNMLLVKLDEERVRTNEMDMERWLLTITRGDPRLGEQTRERLRKKFSPT